MCWCKKFDKYHVCPKVAVSIDFNTERLVGDFSFLFENSFQFKHNRIEMSLAYMSDKLVVLSGVAVRVCPLTKQGNLQ